MLTSGISGNGLVGKNVYIDIHCLGLLLYGGILWLFEIDVFYLQSANWVLLLLIHQACDRVANQVGVFVQWSYTSVKRQNRNGAIHDYFLYCCRQVSAERCYRMLP